MLDNCLPDYFLAALSRHTACGRRVSLPYSDRTRSVHALIDTTALMRGSKADAMRLIPAPYETPDAPMCCGSAEVLATIQSMTVETSAMSFGPAVSICPPEPQKPRVV